MFYVYFSIFSFLQSQSEAFKEAFFGPIKHTEKSRSKRQAELKEEDDTSLENELETIKDENSSSSQEDKTNVTEEQENEATLSTTDVDDEAINCNWNIKVIRLFLV